MMQLTSLFQSLRRHFIPASVVTNVETCPAAPTPQRISLPATAAAPRMSAVEILRNEPNLTAGELAERAGVTLSYANSLVRRRKSKPMAVAAVRSFNGAENSVLVEAHAREQIEQAAASGLTVEQIAEQFRIVSGEVEFALKIARLAKKA